MRRTQRFRKYNRVPSWKTAACSAGSCFFGVARASVRWHASMPQPAARRLGKYRVHKPRRVPRCFAASGPLTAIRVFALLRIASRSCLLASLVHLPAGMQACRVHLHGDWAYARMLQICYGNVDKRNKHIYNVRCIDQYDGADRSRWLNMSAAVVLMNVNVMERR